MQAIVEYKIYNHTTVHKCLVQHSLSLLCTGVTQLLHPLGKNSPISSFLRKRPEGGMHHICIEVCLNCLPQYLSYCDRNSAPLIPPCVVLGGRYQGSSERSRWQGHTPQL